MGKLEVTLPVPDSHKALHGVIASTGLKDYGEGDWKVRSSRSRQTSELAGSVAGGSIPSGNTARQLPLALDEGTGEILAAVVSPNDWGDSEILPDLGEQIEGDLAQISGDGAYDKRGCYDTITERRAQPVIPPRKTVIWQHGNCKAPPHQRDAALGQVRKQGRKRWKQDSGYHRRSLAETAMFRHKTGFGGKAKSRKVENQATELLCQCAMLNRMIQLGKPVRIAVAA